MPVPRLQQLAAGAYSRLYRALGPRVRSALRGLPAIRRIHEYVNSRVVGSVALPPPLEDVRLFGSPAMLNIYATRGWEPQVIRAAELLVGAGDICLDVGAHYGVTAIWMSRLAGTSGRVVAFEPDPRTHAVLLRNLEANGCENVVPRRVALGEEASVSHLHQGIDSMYNSLVSIEDGLRAKSLGAVDVEVQRLDALWSDLALERLDFVKIDIEGYEHQALAGAAVTLQQYRPSLLLEMHPHIAGSTSQAAGDLLTSWGYVFFSLSAAGELQPRPDGPIRYEQLVALPPDHAFAQRA